MTNQPLFTFVVAPDGTKTFTFYGDEMTRLIQDSETPKDSLRGVVAPDIKNDRPCEINGSALHGYLPREKPLLKVSTRLAHRFLDYIVEKKIPNPVHLKDHFTAFARENGVKSTSNSHFAVGAAGEKEKLWAGTQERKKCPFFLTVSR